MASFEAARNIEDVVDGWEDPEEWRPSRAVVAQGEDKGVMLWWDGSGVEQLASDVSPRTEDVGLDDAPVGISIWEGEMETQRVTIIDSEEYESELRGKFRSPTDEEWTAIREGRSPWEVKP